MEGVFFIRFPQFKREPDKCSRWANACRRENFNAMSVKKDTYICSLHFKGGKGPTEDFPDPIPATATKYEVKRHYTDLTPVIMFSCIMYMQIKICF